MLLVASAEAKGKSEGKSEGALAGSVATLASLLVVQLVWGGVQRVRGRRAALGNEQGVASKPTPQSKWVRAARPHADSRTGQEEALALDEVYPESADRNLEVL